MGRLKAKPVKNNRGRHEEGHSFVLSSSSSTARNTNTNIKNNININKSTTTATIATAIDRSNNNRNDLVDSDSEVEGEAIAAPGTATNNNTKRRLRKKKQSDNPNCHDDFFSINTAMSGEEKKEDVESQHEKNHNQEQYQDDAASKTTKEIDEPRKPDPELEIVKCRRKTCKTILKFTQNSQPVKNKRRSTINEEEDEDENENVRANTNADTVNNDGMQHTILCTLTLPETSIEEETQVASSDSSKPSLEDMAFVYTIQAQDTVIQLLKHYSKKYKTKKIWDPILPSLQHNLLRMEIQQYASPSSAFQVKLRFILTQKAYQHCSPYKLPRKVPLRRMHSQKKVNDKYLAIILQEALRVLLKSTCLDELLPIVVNDKQSQRKKQRSKGIHANEEVGDITAKFVYNVVDNMHSNRIETTTASTCTTTSRYKGSGARSVLEDEYNQTLGNGSGRGSISASGNTCTNQAKIPGLVPKLRKYQEAAVKWMLQRERGECEDKGWELTWVFIHNYQDVSEDSTNCTQGSSTILNGTVCPLYKVKTPFPTGSIFYNPFTGWIVDNYEAAKVSTIGNVSAVRGGILAESMGLGKTVEVLACILSNPCPSTDQSTDNEQSDDSRDHTEDSAAHSLTDADIDAADFATSDFVCFCGRNGTTKNSLTWVLCSNCHEPMHGQCAGFAESTDLLSATGKISNFSDVRICDEQRCPTCIAAKHTMRGSGLIQSRATLIVTPPSILSQWEREIKRHTLINDVSDKTNSVRPLKVKVYSGVKEICNLSHVQAKEGFQRRLLNPHFLADADIVLTTFPTLMNDLGHSNDNPYATSEGRDGRRASRNGKRYRVVPSPLMSINWWRIALDEAQRVETPTAASARMALKLVSEHRWCVSGTPIGRGKMQDLYGLLLFLGTRPFCEKDWFQVSVKARYCDTQERIAHMLQGALWRSTKANDIVRQQMGIPEQFEKKVFLRFSSVERHFYHRQLEETILAADVVIGDKQSKKRKRKAKDTDMLSHHLHRLRAACCHPQVGSSGISKVQKTSSSYGGTSVANGVLSMSQILDRLIDDAKIKSEEAQRLYTLNTNAMACLYKLKAESGVRSGTFLDQDDEVVLLQRSCQAYIEAIEVADTNSSPCSIVGEACLSGSIGFQSPGKVVRDGAASLQWLLHEDEGGETPEVWSRFDFSGAAKKITSIAVRHVNRPRISNDSPSKETLYPRKCVLQVSNAAIGGLFVDALSFTLSRPDCSTVEEIDFDWQQFKGFRPHKSKSWRILVKNYYPLEQKNEEAAPSKLCVTLEVQLMEPDIVPDSLQRLHILHNGVLTLNVLQKKNNDDEDLGMESESHTHFTVDKVEETISNMKDEQESLEAHYIEGARVLQLTSQVRLNDATKRRKDLREELIAMDRTTLNEERQPWWQDLFAYCHLHSNPRIQSSLAENVEQSMSDLHNDPSQPFNRRSFPITDTLNGLNIAFNMRLHENPFFPDVIDNDVYTCIDTIHKLSDHPSPTEIFENSHCHKCRSDWDQNGPKCQCCKLEEQLVEFQTRVKDTEINCVLTSMFHWMRYHQNKFQQASKTGSINLKTLSKKAETFFELKDEVVKELDCAKSKWRTHLDLLSDIDELNQCKRTMRLAYVGENLYGLSAHEQAFIVQPRDIAGLIMDHTAKQAMAEGNLRRTKELLRFLKNQNIERMKIVEGDNSGDNNTCCICLCNFEKERAVLRCGHTYHYSPCLERLFARGGGNHTIICPMRCAIRTKRDEILIASDISKDDGSKLTKQIKGQWGTKVDRLISDLLGVVEIGEKSIVFSQWDDMLSIMECAFAANSIRFVRPKSIKKFGDYLSFFRSNNCHVLLLHVKHGAEGLTLVEANHVFMIEPLLNHSIDSQAINRIHRIGQTSKTYIHRYVIEDTIEIKIDRMRAERQCQEGEEEDTVKEAKETLRAGGLDGGFNATELQELLTKL